MCYEVACGTAVLHVQPQESMRPQISTRTSPEGKLNLISTIDAHCLCALYARYPICLGIQPDAFSGPSFCL